MKKVSVIGAGSWGTAIAFVLAENGHDCLLWARREDQSAEITNEQYEQRLFTKHYFARKPESNFKS